MHVCMLSYRHLSFARAVVVTLTPLSRGKAFGVPGFGNFGASRALNPKPQTLNPKTLIPINPKTLNPKSQTLKLGGLPHTPASEIPEKPRGQSTVAFFFVGWGSFWPA